MNGKRFVFWGALLFASAGLTACSGSSPIAGTPEPTACTQEAKQCPDGSYVGRTGPQCEFAPCPAGGETSPDPSWKTAQVPGQGISYQYPPTLGTKFIDTQEWPPKVEAKASAFACDGETKALHDRTYCVKVETGAAAGSAYKDYRYTTPLEGQGKTLTLRFALRYPQCANYDAAQKKECETEEKDFNIDGLVDLMVSTVKFDESAKASSEQRVSVEGLYHCLEHKDGGEFHTMECAFGLRADDGSLYALDFSALSQLPPEKTDTRIAVEGVFTPIESLSTDQWKQYGIKGILRVTAVKAVAK